MDRDDLAEFHCIQPIENLPSIGERGILSHNGARGIPHRDVSNAEVQEKREVRTVPQADGSMRPLHDYANVFFHARNPMLFDRQHLHEELCVLRLKADLLDYPGAVIADGNAASDYSRLEPAPEGLAFVDRERTFAEYWTHANLYEYYERKRRRGAELLVPDRIPPDYINGVYVSCDSAAEACGAYPWPVTKDPDLFFQS